MRDPSVRSLYFVTPLAFNAKEGFSWDDLRKICTEVEGWPRYKMAKKYCQSFNGLIRAHERYK